MSQPAEQIESNPNYDYIDDIYGYFLIFATVCIWVRLVGNIGDIQVAWADGYQSWYTHGVKITPAKSIRT